MLGLVVPSGSTFAAESRGDFAAESRGDFGVDRRPSPALAPAPPSTFAAESLGDFGADERAPPVPAPAPPMAAESRDFGADERPTPAPAPAPPMAAQPGAESRGDFVADMRPSPMPAPAPPMELRAVRSYRVTPAYRVIVYQGLTLVHFPAQRKHFTWDRGCIKGLLRGCLGGVKELTGGIQGCVRYILCQKTAQVKLKSERV